MVNVEHVEPREERLGSVFTFREPSEGVVDDLRGRSLDAPAILFLVATRAHVIEVGIEALGEAPVM